MQKITREAIRLLASSDTVYYRGIRYYAAHAVSNVTWNEGSRQYRGNVKGSNLYTVIVQMNDNNIIHSCNCPTHAKYSGACKHVVALLLFVSDYLQRENIGDTLQEGDKTAYNIVEYFRKQEYNKLTPNYYHLKLKINIPSFMKSNNSKAFLSLLAGCDRMYTVQNVKKFINDYYDENAIELGSYFNYIPGECEFDEKSVAVLEYLTEIYEIQEKLGRSYSADLYSRHEIILSKNMLYRLLNVSEGLSCHLTIFGKEAGEVNIMKKNPELNIELIIEENILRVKNANEKKLYSLCNDGSIIYYDGIIYLPEKEFINTLLPFYSSIFMEEGGSVEFRNANKNGFVEKVLPIIKKSMNVLVPDEIKDNYIVEQLNPQLYLDINHKRGKYSVSAVLKFMYGVYEINPLGEETESKFIIVRDYEEEERLIRILYSLNFKVYDDCFVLHGDNDIFEILTEKSRILTDNFEVYYSKSYKSLYIKKPGNLSANIRYNTDINLLEMDIDYSRITKEELKDFFKALRLKKKYYRLKSGEFISLEDDKNIQALKLLMENGELSDNGTLKVNRTSALYIDDIFPKNSHITKSENLKELINDIKNPETVVWDIPKGINAVLRNYQKIGYQWLKTLERYGFGGILADDMGLGKTLQAIVYICSSSAKKSLIVCPTSLSYNWQEEFLKFAPSVRTCVISGSVKERENLLKRWEEFDVWITTYPLIRRDMENYKKVNFDIMFVDEAQFIKNPASVGAKAVKSVIAAHKFALTGTPIENALSELWSIFDYIMPGFLGKHSWFSDYYEKPILNENNKNRMEELKLRIQPFILRRMKKDVLKDLPDKTETRRMAYMTKKQQKIYISYLSRIQTEFKENKSLENGQSRIHVLAALTRLRQICCHPATFIDNYTGGSGKLDLLMEQLPDILDSGHSVLIFSQFTSMLSIIADTLKDNNIQFFYLSGSTKPAVRRQYVKEFNQGSIKVFLISLKAGGTGLNLTGADTIIHFDPWWNPAVEEQATDRAYRIGQKKNVHVIKYVMKDSIEEKIYELQKRKKILSDSIIEAEEVFINKLTDEEIKGLFDL